MKRLYVFGRHAGIVVDEVIEYVATPFGTVVRCDLSNGKRAIIPAVWLEVDR